MTELYQLQPSSPVTTRPHQACSAVTGAMGYDPNNSLCILNLCEKVVKDQFHGLSSANCTASIVTSPQWLLPSDFSATENKSILKYS